MISRLQSGATKWNRKECFPLITSLSPQSFPTVSSSKITRVGCSSLDFVLPSILGMKERSQLQNWVSETPCGIPWSSLMGQTGCGDAEGNPPRTCTWVLLSDKWAVHVPPKGQMNTPCEATHLKTALLHLAGHHAHVQTNSSLLMTQGGLITLSKSICISLNCVLYEQQHFFSWWGKKRRKYLQIKVFHLAHGSSCVSEGSAVSVVTYHVLWGPKGLGAWLGQTSKAAVCKTPNYHPSFHWLMGH